MSDIAPPEEIIARISEWEGRKIGCEVLPGGLANRSYLLDVDGERYVLKSLTQAMGEFSLMIPIPDVIRNTTAAGLAGVGARVVRSFPDAMVLGFIDGVTLCTADLSTPHNISRLGQAIARLHQDAAPFGNVIEIWTFLDNYVELIRQHDLPTEGGILDGLDLVRTLKDALDQRALPLVPSHNDLLPLNIMDDGDLRLIDYDFSGMNDPAFDLGDLAMEGKYDPDQTAQLCESYFGRHDSAQVARAELFGVAAQYTWSLLFTGMHHLLPEAPDEDFDYLLEAASRWEWARQRLDDSTISGLIKRATEAPN
jgi:thiamine kinase-like enzyme